MSNVTNSLTSSGAAMLYTGLVLTDRPVSCSPESEVITIFKAEVESLQSTVNAPAAAPGIEVCGAVLL